MKETTNKERVPVAVRMDAMLSVDASQGRGFATATGVKGAQAAVNYNRGATYL